MKKINLIFLFFLVIALFCSCGYEDVAYDDEVAQQVYLPAANYSPYQVADSTKSYAVPTTGKQKRYSISSGKMIIPLGVYRSGLNSDGNVLVNIQIDTDTLNQMSNAGLLGDMEILPASQVTLPGSVTINEGKELGSFEMQVDLNFLLSNPGKKFAIAVSISSTDRKVTPKLKTVLVVIDSNLASQP